MRKVLYILGKLHERDIDWFVQAGERKRVDAGTVLIERGKPVDDVYVVLEGHLAVSSGGQPLGALGVGEVVGELSFLDSRPPSATVTAKDDSVVLCIPRRALQKKLDAEDGFAARFYRALGIFLADRLRSTVMRLGYDGDGKLEAEEEYADELDEELLDDLALAGSRFDWILQRLRGH